MTIKKYWFWQIPQLTSNTILVIDAYAATTNLCLMLSQNPKRIVIVNNKNLDQAKSFYPNSLVIGESLFLPLEIFQVSNLPIDIVNTDLRNKTILYMSINGTKVLESVFARDKIILSCSFNSLKAVKEYLLTNNVKEITIVMAGDEEREVEEDRLCADILSFEILGKKYNWDKVKKMFPSL